MFFKYFSGFKAILAIFGPFSLLLFVTVLKANDRWQFPFQINYKIFGNKQN